MQTLIQIIHVVVSVFMILVILLQAGKSGGLGLSGGSATVFGGRGSQTFLGKITTVCAAIFMISSLSLAYMSSRTDSAVLNRQRNVEAKKAADEKKAGATPAASPAPGAGSTNEAAPAGSTNEAPKAEETK